MNFYRIFDGSGVNFNNLENIGLSSMEDVRSKKKKQTNQHNFKQREKRTETEQINGRKMNENWTGLIMAEVRRYNQNGPGNNCCETFFYRIVKNWLSVRVLYSNLVCIIFDGAEGSIKSWLRLPSSSLRKQRRK